MIFIDFDKTIFNHDAFRDYLRAREDLPFLSDMHGEQMTAACWAAAEEGTISFEKGELSPFVFEDAAEHIRSLENSGIIITYGNKKFQKMKIESALFGIPRLSIMYTELERKGNFLAPHVDMYGQSPVLVDDDPTELAILSETCPTFRLFEMRRDGKPGDGRWPVLSSLSDLKV